MSSTRTLSRRNESSGSSLELSVEVFKKGPLTKTSGYNPIAESKTATANPFISYWDKSGAVSQTNSFRIMAQLSAIRTFVQTPIVHAALNAWKTRHSAVHKKQRHRRTSLLRVTATSNTRVRGQIYARLLRPCNGGPPQRPAHDRQKQSSTADDLNQLMKIISIIDNNEFAILAKKYRTTASPTAGRQAWSKIINHILALRQVGKHSIWKKMRVAQTAHVRSIAEMGNEDPWGLTYRAASGRKRIPRNILNGIELSGGNPLTDPGAYQPMTLVPILGKILERALLKRATNITNSISQCQHRFSVGRSADTAMKLYCGLRGTRRLSMCKQYFLTYLELLTMLTAHAAGESQAWG
ncbi:hypothetical protein EVAR_24824_1 [Eumeta japonica]|uniref:Reverse transcriptase domain-containing protein n=1 Tax=Eumeta variegata TaxID=151549 RepID=A0A4C1W338_EUMVA|nr:hypothetical protein EVAR_24824_1 [Eumeta japonica]